MIHFFDGEPKTPLWYLGESIKLLGQADIAYFCKDWEKYRGCCIEHECCVSASWEKGLNYVAEGSITSREYMDKLEHFIRVKVGGVLQVNYQAALRSRYDSIAGNYRKGGK